MSQVARRTKRTLAVAVPVAMVAGAGALTLAEREALGCKDALFERPLPMERALKAPGIEKRALARANKVSTAKLDAQVDSDAKALWSDRCGLAFYVDEATPESAQEERTEVAEPTSARAPLAMEPLADTFSLNSRPDAKRTIYLDFRGDKVTGTAWNASYGSSIDVPAYTSDASADTNFSSAELTEIQRAWQVVAEDYAPFDVNVTTKEPPAAALERESYSDEVYGVTVHITAGGPIFDACRCGGVAYVNTFNVAGPNHEYYQPAWVFTNGTGTSGKSMGEAISHEVGHNFGLSHDGTADRGYYSGATPWAPVMGVGYYQPMSQWSAGEYAGASQSQDDVKIIATGAPVVADDHGDTSASATPLRGSRVGVIASRTDVDAFSASAAGRTKVVVSPAAAFANLDVKLTVLRADGSTLSVVDPPVSKTSSSEAGGLGATWTGDVDPAGSTLFFVIDGVGKGDPAASGGYSDYGSLGRYSIVLSTQDPVVDQPQPDPEPSSEPSPEPKTEPSPEPKAEPSPEPSPEPEPEPEPLAVDLNSLAAGEQGSPYRADAGAASGGSSPYRWSAAGLPAGLSVGDGGIVSGVPQESGSFTPTITVTDAAGGRESGALQLTVDPAQTVEPLSFRSTGQLKDGKQRRRYRTVLRVDGGADVRTWQVQGRLPRGLRLRTNRMGTAAAIKGKPRRPGLYGFVLRVTDGSGEYVVGGYQITVKPKPRRRR